MKDNSITIGEITKGIEKSSTDFEKTNTDLKRKYLVWNIEVFNKIASKVKFGKGSFGTGYPFYVLDENLEGTIPVITEQVRYNRQLVKDGQEVQKSIYQCKACLDKLYDTMPDLKSICRPCPKTKKSLKPRKLINRLPDIDMWLVCEDGHVEEVQEELSKLLQKSEMHTSDEKPFKTMSDIEQISEMIKKGEMPGIFLPIDAHIVEYSTIKKLMEQMPKTLELAEQMGIPPYLPIHPKSYRKTWQYDDEAYNYVYDYMAAFTPFNFPEELENILMQSRKQIVSKYTPEELYDILIASATESNARRFYEPALEERFKNKIKKWKENLIDTNIDVQKIKRKENNSIIDNKQIEL